MRLVFGDIYGLKTANLHDPYYTVTVLYGKKLGIFNESADHSKLMNSTETGWSGAQY